MLKKILVFMFLLNVFRIHNANDIIMNLSDKFFKRYGYCKLDLIFFKNDKYHSTYTLVCNKNTKIINITDLSSVRLKLTCKRQNNIEIKDKKFEEILKEVLANNQNDTENIAYKAAFEFLVKNTHNYILTDKDDILQIVESPLSK